MDLELNKFNIMNKKEVINFVKEMNNVWAVNNNPDDLINYFHPNISQVMPASAFRISGRDNVIKTFKDYLDLVSIKKFESDSFEVEIISDNFAVCSYKYRIVQQSDVETSEHSGMDILTLNKSDNRWKVVNLSA